MKRNVSKYPELAGLMGAEYIRGWERLKARELDAQGLTTRRTVRVRRPMVRLDDLRGLSRRDYNRLRARRWRARRREVPSVLELQWKFMRKELGRE